MTLLNKANNSKGEHIDDFPNDSVNVSFENGTEDDLLLNSCKISSPEIPNATIGWLPSSSINSPEKEHSGRTGEWLLTSSISLTKNQITYPEIYYTKAKNNTQAFTAKHKSHNTCHRMESENILDNSAKGRVSSNYIEEYHSDECSSSDNNEIAVDEIEKLTAKIRRSNRVARPVYDSFIDQQVLI